MGHRSTVLMRVNMLRHCNFLFKLSCNPKYWPFYFWDLLLRNYFQMSRNKAIKIETTLFLKNDLDFFNIKDTQLNCWQKNVKIVVHCCYERYLISNLRRAWKKSRLELELSLWPLRYWCSALPIELSSQLGVGQSFLSLQWACRWSQRSWVRILFKPGFFSSSP